MGLAVIRLMERIIAFITGVAAWPGRRRNRTGSAGRSIATERVRRQRELARSQGQAGHNLTVQTTIDMARTQTWTGGG